MKKNLVYIAAVGATIFGAANVSAQDTVVVNETVIDVTNVECKDNYSPASWRNGWFLQAGAGIQMPFVENDHSMVDGSGRHVTAVYNLGVGRWFSPYMGFRFSGTYGSMHWNSQRMASAKQASVNLDFMWDMFNSINGYNPDRVFSIVPFVGLGGTFVWDYKNNLNANQFDNDGKIKSNQWLLPVSAGIQFRFRLCRYVDFFVEGRGSFYGDNFNNVSGGRPVDINLQAIGGLNIRFDGAGMSKYNPCDYAGYVSSLNNQVNDLRNALATSEAARAAAEAQLPCPEVVVTEAAATVVNAPLLPSVRFKINSAYVSSEEMVNVYNVAEYLKANPGTSIVVRGYADKDTGSAAYNQKLSERRAQAVADILVNDYGVDASRLTVEAAGSSVQPYDTNNWNRIVLFAQPE
ncbi:MAG: OmpA family protein [Bacteroides sp.]|nr:OmpA family protein [Barnesiella sp.]MBD5368779.1 OmpA family protein [Bacteroides sp.]MDE5829347.1 OmpA family protein [Duncaniella sp.]